jgi:hypothetical protein
MKLLVFGFAVWVAMGLSGSLVGVQAHEPATQAKDSAAEEFAAIQNDWSQAQQAYRRALQEAKPGEERTRVLKEKRPKPDAFAERCLKLAQAHPDSPAAVQALAWVMGSAPGTEAARKALTRIKEKLASITDLDMLQKRLAELPSFGLGELAPAAAEKARRNLDHPRALPLLLWVCSQTRYSDSKELTKLYNETVDLVMDRFLERKELAQLAGWLTTDDNPVWAEKHLRRLLEKNPADAVKAQATFGLASVLKNKDEASQPEAERLFASVIERKTPAYVNLAGRAKTELDDNKLRGIGKPAPEILGADLDGKEFKLSDYKGKVVLLDFWGFW